MALKLASAILEPYPHQNPNISAVAAQLGGIEDITVSATTQAINVDVFQTRATTSATSSVATLPAGTFPGQKKVISLKALGTAGQSLAITPGAGVTWKQADGTTAVASVTLSAVGKFVQAEWDGLKWVNKSADATIA